MDQDLLAGLSEELIEALMLGNKSVTHTTTNYQYTPAGGCTAAAIHAALIGRSMNLTLNQRLYTTAIVNNISVALLNFDRQVDHHDLKIQNFPDLLVNDVNFNLDSETAVLQAGLVGHLYYGSIRILTVELAAKKLFPQKRIELFVQKLSQVFYDVLFRSIIGKVTAKTGDSYNWGLKSLDLEKVHTESRYNEIPGIIAYLFLPPNKAKNIHLGYRLWGTAFQIDDDLIDIEEDTKDPHPNYGIGLAARGNISITDAIAKARVIQGKLLKEANDLFHQSGLNLSEELLHSTTINWSKGNIFKDLLKEVNAQD